MAKKRAEIISAPAPVEIQQTPKEKAEINPALKNILLQSVDEMHARTGAIEPWRSMRKQIEEL